jgi:methylenetetrahydrofolate dehydrogenase (NADP+)/methenyltetrahydrofolate cyclohydrolase
MSGRPIHEKALERARGEVKLLEEYGVTPSLAIILLNDDPIELETQRRYAELKARDVKRIGGEAHIFELHDVPPERRAKEALKLIRELNSRDDVTGVIVQKPVPPWLDDSALLAALDPAKDVDGLTPERKKALVSGPLDKAVLPCTPAGIIELLAHYGVDVRGRDVVVVGKGELVGFPLSVLLMRLDATVTVLHALTPEELKLRRVREADIVISAVGRPPELYRENPWRLTGDMIKEGAVVVGVGGKMGPDKRWYFDVDEESVAERASAYTPNVGGVGLVTRAKIIENLIKTAWAVAERAASPRLAA